MNDPKRLLAPDGDAATGFERQLLQAVLDERPSEAATQRMLEATLAAGTATAPSVAGMGAGAWFASTAVAVGIAGLAAAVWLGGSGTAAEEAVHAPSGAPPIDAAKENAITDAASTGADAGAHRASGDVEREAMNATGHHAPAQQAIPDARGSATPEVQDATTGSARGEPTQDRNKAGATRDGSSSATTTATTTGRTPRERAAGSAAAPLDETSRADETSRTLREEVQLLDRARSALRAGDAGGAFAALERYDRRFPSGMLRKESSLLRQRASALANENPDER